MTPITATFEQIRPARNPALAAARIAAIPVGKAVETVRRFQAWRMRRATERLIEGLPLDIRKDIGWPDPDRR